MPVFISYSSQDRPALDGLLAALNRARQKVWLDEQQLSGGEAWWQVILEQIRGCDVFIVALSNNSLDSKPCQAELRYAQELKRHILPVQIGQIDSMRANPLATLQVIDYRNPSADTAIQLIAAVHEQQAKTVPLPDPLPEEPPVPFEYLMRLATALEDRELSPQQQTTLFNELRSALEEDGREPAVRRDIMQLLLTLQNRPDVTWKTRNDVEKMLASIGPHSSTQTSGAIPTQTTYPGFPTAGPQTTVPGFPAAGPQATVPGFPAAGPQTSQAGFPAADPQRSGSSSTASQPPPPWSTGPQPMAGPPTGPQMAPLFNGAPPTERTRKGWSRKRWLITGGAALAVVAAIVVAIVLIIPSPPPPPPPRPLMAPEHAGSILLSADQVNSFMNASGMVPADTPRQAMFQDSVTLSKPECLGALYSAEDTVYKGSGWSGVAGQVVREPGNNPDHFVVQSAVVFPTVDQAHAFLTDSIGKWKDCAGQVVGVTTDGNTYRWTFGQLTGGDPKIEVLNTQEGEGGWACQHVLDTASNVLADVVSCAYHITDEGSRIADRMIANANS